MFEEMRRRGLTQPIYSQSSSSVKVTLSAADAVADEVLARLPRASRRILDEMRMLGKPLGTGQIAELADISRPTAVRALSALETEGLLTWEASREKTRGPRGAWRDQRGSHRTPGSMGGTQPPGRVPPIVRPAPTYRAFQDVSNAPCG